MNVSSRGRELHSALFLAVFFLNTWSVGLWTGMCRKQWQPNKGSKQLEWWPLPTLVIADYVSLLWFNSFMHCMGKGPYCARNELLGGCLFFSASAMWWHQQGRHLSCSVSGLAIHCMIRLKQISHCMFQDFGLFRAATCLLRQFINSFAVIKLCFNSGVFWHNNWGWEILVFQKKPADLFD